MSNLEYDPKTKQQIKNALYEYIYAPITRKFRERVSLIIDQNTALGGYSHRSFLYKGIVYNNDVTAPPLRKNRLLAQMRPSMDDYLRDNAELNNKELPLVMGFLTQMLNASSSLSDYLLVLPESLHAPLIKLRDTCPCRHSTLSPDRIHTLQKNNQPHIELIKKRLVLNLIL